MLSSIDYQRLKERYTRNIKLASLAGMALVVMMVYNVVSTTFRFPFELDFARIIIPDLLYSYGFRATVNAELGVGITLLALFAIIFAVVIFLVVFACKQKRWAFLWLGFFVLADMPLLIVIKNYQAIAVHGVLLVVLIIGAKMAGENAQLDKRLWSF